MKKILFMILIITNCSLNISAALNSTHWRTITKDIARDGDPKDRTEFEAARQAFLHIKDETEALAAALDIQNRWEPSFGIDATRGTKDRRGSLMSLKRYPLMTKEDAKNATHDLLNNRTVAQFLNEQKLKMSSPTKS